MLKKKKKNTFIFKDVSKAVRITSDEITTRVSYSKIMVKVNKIKVPNTKQLWAGKDSEC